MPDSRDSIKTIGLIGGMSWESSALYYRLINEETKKQLGGHHNAKSVMVTVDFDEIEQLQRSGDWPRMGAILAEAARRLEAAGADFLVLCTNTMHKVAASIERAVSLPLLHIVDATAAAIHANSHTRVGLLGTRFTMEDNFYRTRLSEKFGIEAIVPDADARTAVHRIIYDELCHGILRQESRSIYLQIIGDLHQRGAQSIILGCTEIELLLTQADSSLPLYASTHLHAKAAVAFALAGSTVPRV